ncbi:AAA family ATPase [Burkholderia gladioli]|uniref:AAA family ATPase n=1 Tax=Burkholderia gladioli TaxID=28095 RepID=UPI00163FB5D8|nr:AAA family ATPase [Burkholderia gladioli]
MRLETLRLTNFRGYVDSEFTLHPQFNLVIGENGTGKTSFLEATAVAIGSWLLGFRGHDSRNILDRDVRHVLEYVEKRYRELPQYPVRVQATGFVHIAKAGRARADGEIQYEPPTSPAKPNPREKHVRWERSIEAEGGKTTRRGANDLKKYAEAMASAVLKQDARVLPLIRYFGAGRLWESVRDTHGKALSKHKGKQPQELAEDADAIETALRDHSRFSEPFYGYRMSVDKRCNPDDLIRWMGIERRNELDEEDVSPALRSVYRAIETLLPEISTARYSVRLQTLVLKYNDGQRRTFQELSDGYRNIVAISADLAIKAVMLNPQLAEKALEMTPGVVLIDELDLHLHPRWQVRVIEDLRRTFPLVQFICTTHSPFLVQTLRSGNELIVLDAAEASTSALSENDDLKDKSDVVADKLDNLGIEAIARGIMGVEAQASPRYMEMLKAAKGYLVELDEAARSPADRLEEYKRLLSERLAPFADNPAFQAVLEAERIDKLGK